jgi:hypothetical protein
LVDASESIERHFNAPQDIEWAFANNSHWILQSRPVTNLPAAPLTGVKWEPPRPGAKLIRRQVVEHMPGPLSPLFDELYLRHGLEKSMNAFYWFEVSVILGLSKVTDNLLNSFLIKIGEGRGLTSGLFLRGFLSKTLEAQVDLEAIAHKLRVSSDLRKLAVDTPASQLLDAFQAEPDAEDALQGIQTYFEKYGH